MGNPREIAGKRHNVLDNSLTGIFENMPGAFCLYELCQNSSGSEDLRIIMLNEAFASLHGESVENMDGKLFTEACRPGLDYLASYINAAKTRESSFVEAYNFHLKKHIRHDVFSPAPGQVAIMVTDRSCAVESEDALKSREDDISMLFASMTSGFCLGRIIRNKEGRPVDAFFEMTNSAFEMMENSGSIPLQGRGLFESDPCADRFYFDIYADVAVNRKKTSFRKFIPSTGATLDVVCYSPKEDFFACVQSDITDRVTAERKLQRAYTDTEAILHEIPAPICVVNGDSGLVLDCNAAFINICSPDAEKKIIGSHISESFGKTACGGVILDLLRKGSNFKCKLLNRPDADVIDVEIFSRPFMYNVQPSFVLYCVDLTRQKAQEKALMEAAEAAEEASRMKSNFLASVSHEMRTPLNSVIGFAELVLDVPGLTETARDYISKINVSASGLLEIINDILDLSMIEAGKMELVKKPFSLNDVLRYCESVSSRNAREKNLKLYFCSEALAGKKLAGDPVRLQQILLNLLSNAVKFTDSGMVRMTSSIQEESEDRVVVHFEVKDSGIGITPEQMKRLFTPFMQADSGTTRKYGGTGLGLVITKNLVEMMGGELNVDSAPGVGSRFSFSIGFDTAAASPDEDLLPESRHNAARKPMFSGEALVFEDSLFNQQVIGEHLKRVGITAVIASDGKEGVEIAKERMAQGKPFDIILMDIHMPVMDGFEASGKLMELGVTAPIVAMTAGVLTEDKKAYRAAGMSDYLGKPFTAESLWACLSKHLTPVYLETGESSSEIPGAPQNGGEAVNRELGLLNAAGDKAFYDRLLALFSKSNADICPKLREALDSGDTKLAYRMAHTLKSVSATIGAVRLSELAAQLEITLSGESPDYWPERFGALENEMASVLRELEPFAKEKSRPVKSGAVREKPSALIARLKPLLTSGNTDCLELLDEIYPTLSYAGESCGELISFMEDYDFDSALEVLARITDMPEEVE